MNAKHEKYSDKGLVVLGVSNEPAGKLDGFVQQFKTQYPIISAPAGGNAYGVRAYPTYVLVSARGRVIKTGQISAADIEAALEEVVLFPPVPEDIRALKKLRKAAADGDPADVGKALTDAEQDADLDDKAKQVVAVVRSAYDKLCKATLSKVEAMNGPDYGGDLEVLEEIAKQFKGLPIEEAAEAKIKVLKRDPKIKKELRAAKQLAALRRRYDAKSLSQRKKLSKGLERLIKTNAGTYAAKKAEELQRLIAQTK